MSKFKTNTRFSSLVENDILNQDKKSMTNDKHNKTETNNNFLKKSSKQIDEIAKSSFLDKQTIMENKMKKDLSPENFPDLISKPLNKTPINAISFSEKLQSDTINTDPKKKVNSDYKPLMPGWVLIKRDTVTQKIITEKKYSLEVRDVNDIDNYNIFSSLVELHTKRMNEYIDSWGYDEWVNMFKFPNYDYEYFDKLDDLYYQDIEDEKSEYEEDYDEDRPDYEYYD